MDDRAAPALRRPIAVALLCLAAVSAASAQVLDLGSAKPPPLGPLTAADELSGTLEQEIAALLAALPAGSDAPAARASINVRIIAADLLRAGDAAGSTGSEAIVAGVTMANGRGALDELLGGSLDDAARAALRRFNEGASRHAGSVRTADTGRLDAALPQMLAPLAEALARLGATPRSHWPRREALAASGAMIGGGDEGAPPMDELIAAVGAAPLAPETAELLREILDYVQRAAKFPELRPAVQEHRRAIAGMVEVAESLAAATWLDEEQGRDYGALLHEGALLVRDPSTRERGFERLDRLAVSAGIMQRITRLWSRRAVEETAPLREAFLEADALIGGRAESAVGAAQLRRLRGVLEGMLRFRELEGPPRRRELVGAWRQLERDYRAAEKTLLQTLPSIAAEPEALADPAHSSLLADQQQLVEDLRRIALVPEWIETISLVEPDATGAFTAEMRRMVNGLLQPARRPDSVRAMARFERELGRFHPLVWEVELAAATPAAELATGGLSTRYAAAIVSARRAWAIAWARDGTGGEAAAHLFLLHRLNATMIDTLGVIGLGGDATALNGWAAWELLPSSINRAIAELPGRVKLAVVAAIEGDSAALTRQLERLDEDVPPARLLGRLATILQPHLRDLPGGAAGAIGQLAYPPPRDAWLLEQRRELAEICRYGIEEDRALARGDVKKAAEIAAFVNGRAVEVMRGLESRKSKVESRN